MRQWSNLSGQLKVSMSAGAADKTSSSTFTQSSHKDNVLRLNGTGSANKANSNTFTQGSHKDDVIRLQGTPTSIQRYDALGHEVWYYGNSTVEISTLDDRVRQWSNLDGQLKVSMNRGNKAIFSAAFTQGSHKDDVIRLQGTPTSIQRYDALDHEVWHYGNSTVEISIQDDRVRQWSNLDNQLKVYMSVGSNGTHSVDFTKGSHKDDVIRLQGTPTSIQRYDALGHEVWYYGNSTVEISTLDDRVRQWSNVNGRLKVSMRPAG